jgi:hypothetical protein
LLNNWPALVGLANRSFRVTVRVPGPVTNTADAFTTPSDVVLADGVTYVIVVPEAIPEIISAVASRRKDTVLPFVLMHYLLLCFFEGA